MPRRFLKQFIYGAFFIVFWLAVIYGVWLLVYRPSCTDRIKNQGEEGVDCGGPCAPCAVLGQPLRLRAVWFVDSKTGKVDLAAEIKNPNADWGAKEFAYTFLASDANGKLIGRIPGRSFLLPGETRWIVEPAVAIVGRIADLKLEIPPESVVWQKLRPFAQDVGLPTRNVSFRQIRPPEIGFAEVRGEFVNHSSFTLKTVEVVAVLLDKSREAIGVGKTVLNNVLPGKVQQFVISWPNPFQGEISTVATEAHSNFLADQNFLQKYGD